MASNLGTNFSYRAKDFLDDRQGFAKTLDDLKNWNIPVPESFEVCVENEWYYYNSEINLPATGHWVPKISKSIEDIVDVNRQSVSAYALNEVNKNLDTVKKDITSIEEDSSPAMMNGIIISSRFSTDEELNNFGERILDEIKNGIRGIEINSNLDLDKDGDITTLDYAIALGIFNKLKLTNNRLTNNNTNIYNTRIGDCLIPKITWNLIKPKITWELINSNIRWKLVEGSDQNKIIPTNSTINSVIKGTILDNKTSWIADEVITSNIDKTYTFEIISELDNKESLVGKAFINFLYETYTGSSSIDLWEKSTVNSKTDLKDFQKKFTTNGTLSETKFNCTGGLYPYILIPSKFYNENYKTYVNKNINSDFYTKSVELINDNGITLSYIMYRTNYIQTGSSIGIEIR